MSTTDRIRVTAELSVLLSRANPTISAFVAAKCAHSLVTLSNSIVENETWQCNGFKTEAFDEYINKVSRTHPARANEIQSEAWEKGSALYEQRKAQHMRKAQTIADSIGLSASIVYRGLYGGLAFSIPGYPDRTFNCAVK